MTAQRIIIEEARRQRGIPFVWGKTDCLLGFAAAVAQALTGRDPVAHLRGLYHSDVGAKRVMVENGWESLGDVAASIYTEIPVAMARTGDWALIINPAPAPETIGVVVGGMVAGKTATGDIAQTSLTQATRAFRVE